MTKFNFRLSTYLNLKEKIEDQKKLEYGKSLNLLEAEKQKKEEMIINRSNSINSFKNSINKHISPSDLQVHNNYLSYLKIAIVKQDSVIEKAAEDAELKRQELVEAMKQRKMLDKLKERSLEAYIEESKRDENKITDEIVSYKYFAT